MDRGEVIDLLNQLFEQKIKGQIQIDFSGDNEDAKVRFTNITLDNLEKLNAKYISRNHT